MQIQPHSADSKAASYHTWSKNTQDLHPALSASGGKKKTKHGKKKPAKQKNPKNLLNITKEQYKALKCKGIF